MLKKKGDKEVNEDITEQTSIGKRIMRMILEKPRKNFLIFQKNSE